MSDFTKNILANKTSAYRKECPAFTYRKQLEQNTIMGGVLMNLSKAFYYHPQYGVQESMLKLRYSYLKDRRQAVNINGKLSRFMTILTGATQGSILGPILFNIFINHFIYIFDNENIFNFAE